LRWSWRQWRAGLADLTTLKMKVVTQHNHLPGLSPNH
jgi:hypothetical protein